MEEAARLATVFLAALARGQLSARLPVARHPRLVRHCPQPHPLLPLPGLAGMAGWLMRGPDTRWFEILPWLLVIHSSPFTVHIIHCVPTGNPLPSNPPMDSFLND